MVNRNASKSPPSTPQQTENKDEKKTKTTSGKKLKQTRLSFLPKDTAAGLRKRKLSSPETEQDRDVKIVRREDEDHPEVVVIDADDDGDNKGQSTSSAAAPEDVDMVEVIPCEDSNSVAPSSLADTSLIEEVAEEEPVEEQPDPVNESINLDNSSSEDGGENNAGVASLLEPPTNANGKPLTPRQLEKFMEKKSRHEERMRQKLEREKLLEAKRKEKEEREAARIREKEEREAARIREKEEKEAARIREKEEKEAARLREKEEKERKRQQELELRNEEKRRREEQKEEERRKKEDEKRQKELEEENKRKRASQAFTKFFKVGPKANASAEDEANAGGTQTRPQGADEDDVVEVVNSYFMPFAVKGDMKLAPCVRRVLARDDKQALERVLRGDTADASSVQDLYLKSLKAKTHVPLKGTRTWTVSDSSDEDSEDDLMIVDDTLAHKVEEIKPRKQKYRAKCLMFQENRRPAYYGTWQKKSHVIGPRRPFAKDEKFFDYEVDSDDEWEEEEPGESLHGSDDEKEKESEDDYEVDNEFFVPHGHLSDEELQNEDNEMDDNSPEAQKVKLKLLQDEFNDEMKKKTEKIKPRLIGCIWVDEKGARPDNCPEVFWELLKFRAVLSAGPIVLRAPIDTAPGDGDEEADAEDNDAEKQDKRKGQSLSEEDVRHLIRLVHGNVNSNKFIVKEFQKYLEKKTSESTAAAVASTALSEPAPRVVTNMSILRKIKEMAKYENGSWVVQKEFLERYELSELSLDNKWEYTLTPKRLKVEKKQQPLPTSSPQVAQGPAQVVVNAKTPVRPPVEKESPPSAKHQKEQQQQQQKTNRNSITQFTKVLTTEEKQRQFQAVQVASPKQSTATPASANENKAPVTISAPATGSAVTKEGVASATGAVAQPPPQVKKRVPLLMSVPRGQAISEQSKNLLIKDFLKKQPVADELKKPAVEAANVSPSATAAMETIVLE